MGIPLKGTMGRDFPQTCRFLQPPLLPLLAQHSGSSPSSGFLVPQSSPPAYQEDMSSTLWRCCWGRRAIACMGWRPGTAEYAVQRTEQVQRPQMAGGTLHAHVLL